MFIWNHNSTQIEIGDKAGDVLDVFFLNQRLFLANVWLSKTKAEDVKTGLMGNTKMALSISYRVMYHLPNFWHCGELLALLLLPEETGNVGNSTVRSENVWTPTHIPQCQQSARH